MERPDWPWAKLSRDADDKVVAALPLVDHCLDVGAVMAALLAGAAWRRALEAAAGRALTEVDVARLVVLAALHDLGKANRGFRARWDRGRPRIGHTGQVAALLLHSMLKTGAAARALLALCRDWGAADHLAATLAHHGKPLDEFGSQRTDKPWHAHVDHWMPRDGHDPAADVAALVAAVRARWPAAWEEGAKLPDAPRFVALFAGLVTLADWLGSDTGRFSVDGPHGAAREAMRGGAARAAVAARGLLPLATPAADFGAAFGFDPEPFQLAVASDDLGPVALVEAETGSGKTEAALWRWLALRRRGEVDGLFFALPTRSAAVQLHARVDNLLKRVWPGEEAVLAVPGYLRAGDAVGQALPGYEVRWDDGDGGDRRWAAEHANRFLAARVAVGTVDQALLAALRVKHALFRAAALSRSLLVVDEVHASDAYMGALLERLLDNHVAAGGHALLLSATLGGATRARLLKTPVPTLPQAEAQPYPALSARGAPLRALAATARRAERRVAVETRGDIDAPDAIADRAVAAARRGASVLVVRNSVRGAVAVAQGVEERAPDLMFTVAGVRTLHHGRFAPDDRRRLDAAVTAAFGKGRGRKCQVLVGTQTLEQSLDIDADYLLTDLAPMDVLLQRIGRLHRHARDDRGDHAAPLVTILRPAERDLSALLRRGRGSHGLGGGGAYPDVLQLEATLRLLEDAPTIAIPRDNRRLVEGALHPEALAAIRQQGGAAWINHDAARAGSIYAERDTADKLALDLATRFRDLTFAGTEGAATRLGARDLLVDLAVPLSSPFGGTVTRIAVPHWMAAEGEAETLDPDRFRIGTRPYRYDRWGLRAEP